LKWQPGITDTTREYPGAPSGRYTNSQNSCNSSAPGASPPANPKKERQSPSDEPYLKRERKQTKNS